MNRPRISTEQEIPNREPVISPYANVFILNDLPDDPYELEQTLGDLREQGYDAVQVGNLLGTADPQVFVLNEDILENPDEQEQDIPKPDTLQELTIEEQEYWESIQEAREAEQEHDRDFDIDRDFNHVSSFYRKGAIQTKYIIHYETSRQR